MVPGNHVQTAIDDLGTPLRDVTFVVVDLETTGGSPADCGITEVGAVKSRGGEILGEFATLVDPGTSIPPLITVLTGITEQMVYDAPAIDGVLPQFLEFAHGSVLVAHNAPFDTGFLRAACAACGFPWPGFATVDTADIARRVLTRDEVPNHRLATLARFFRSGTTPSHRALIDARATVDVLHGLLERLGSFGVHTLEELREFRRAPTPEQRKKRHLADGLPDAPGVYLFEGPNDEILYIGKSGNLRRRVRSYFTAAETRRRIREMTGIAEGVRHIVCATGLEAEVRELRLIAEHKPRYNRRSRFPERAVWLKLTVEAFPRLSIVREVRDDGAHYLGPFSSARHAEEARTAIHEAVRLRQCTQRMSVRLIAAGRVHTCVLAELGRCAAPCQPTSADVALPPARHPPSTDAAISPAHHPPSTEAALAHYGRYAEAARLILTEDVRPVATALHARIERLAATQRYEEAGVLRDRLATFVRGTARCQRLSALSECAQLVAARPAFDGGWELAVVRYGRLAGASVIPPGAHPVPYVEAVVATAETVLPGPGPAPRASAEETECVLRWLESPGVRLAEVDGVWSCPVHGAESLRASLP